MTENSGEISLGGSPFELPRFSQYDCITNYLKKKAEQLLLIKNFSLANQEYEALLECAKKNNDLNNLDEIENKLLEINAQILLKDSNRKELKSNFENFLKKDDYDSSVKLVQNLEKFSLESAFTEEYGKLINYIIAEKLKSIDLNDIQTKNIIFDTSKIILSFDPLKYLLEIGKIEFEKGNKPFMLFDLDSTLFDNSPRVHKIIQEYIREKADIFPEEVKKLSSLRREDIVWGIKENLKKVNIADQVVVDNLIEFWYGKFFSGNYIIDVPLTGAQQFVIDAFKLNIRIVYLSGRFETMKEGTVKNFMEHGFPVDENYENLVLKPNGKIPDHIFKHEAMERIRSFGKMIAGFDNEPINTNIFQEHFPESEVFFLKTNHSVNPPNLMDSIHTISNFSYIKTE